jgi:pimeloyl-ACP methyl ester carboxylesterase
MGFLKDLPELFPVAVIVHDAWHTPAHYSHLIDSLSALGYPVACPQLLTAHTESNCTASFHDDCSLIYQLAFDLCSDGNDVIIFGHGYGAFIATEALGELDKRERQLQGRAGGVIGLIALAGLLPDKGESLKDVFAGHVGGEWPEYIRPQVPQPTSPFFFTKRTITQGFQEVELTKPVLKNSSLVLLQPSTFLYNDLGPMSREHWASHLIRFTAKPSDIVCTSTPAWKNIPTTYVLCEDDMFLPESLQRGIAKKAGAQVAEIEDVGHDAFIGKCDELVEIIGNIVAQLYLLGADEKRDAGDKHDGDASSAKSVPVDEQEDPMQKPLRRTTTAP